MKPCLCFLRTVSVLLAAVLLLTACAAPAASPESTSAADSPSKTSSVENLPEDSGFPEETPEVNAEPLDYTDPFIQKLAAGVESLPRRTGIVTYQSRQMLEAMGCAAAAENPRLLSEDQFSFDLTLQTPQGGKTFTGLLGDLQYWTDDPEHLEYNVYGYWGAVRVYGSEVFVADRTGVIRYDLTEQKEERLAFDGLFDKGTQTCVRDIYRTEEGYLVPFYRYGEGLFLGIFDNRTHLQKELLMDGLEPGTTADQNLAAGRMYCDILSCSADGSELLYNDGTSIECLYVIPDEMLFSVYPLLQIQRKELSFRLDRLENAEEQKCLAVVQKDGETLYHRRFSTKLVTPAFCAGAEQYGGELIPEVTLAADGSRAEVFCPYTGLAVELDLGVGTMREEYRLTARQTRGEPFAQTADGQYALYSGARQGFGDIVYSDVILHDTGSDRYTHVGRIGGMYGGGEEAGFFSNGDIYLFGRTNFLVYEKGMPTDTPKFVLGDRFPLGQVDEGNIQTRILFAVRRDPKLFSYIVLYAELPHRESCEELFLNDVQMKVSYEVGLLDENGVLQRSFDTGVPVTQTGFGYNNVDMYLEADGRLHFFTWEKYKENVYDEGLVDLTTGEYTPLKTFVYSND